MSRVLRPMTSIAVPGSLIAGESARDAISLITARPKRGSCSKLRASPMEKALRTIAAISSSLPPSAFALNHASVVSA